MVQDQVDGGELAASRVFEYALEHPDGVFGKVDTEAEIGFAWALGIS